MATIDDVELHLTDVDAPDRSVRATVTIELRFTEEEIAAGHWFRLICELYASDAGEAFTDLPSYPLHTFLFAPALPGVLAAVLATPYRLVQASADPPAIVVEDTVTLEALDEDPEILMETRTERDWAGREIHIADVTTTRDEVFASALLIPMPAIEARSRDRVVPGSERTFPAQIWYDPRLRFRF